MRAVSDAALTAIERARSAFLCACRLDVAVRKPGNVSRASPGHGMQAAMFLASAAARFVTGVVLPVDGGYLIA